MQERNGRFGPNVEAQVHDLEQRYGNVKVVASSSGLMTSVLVQRWIRELLQPTATNELEPLDTDTEVESNLERLSIEDEEVIEAIENEEVYRSIENVPYEGVPLNSPLYGLSLPSSCDEAESGTCSANRTMTTIPPAQTRRHKRPHTLLLLDHFSGHTTEESQRLFSDLGFETLMVPKLCTAHVQPLDVGFNLQYKYFF